MSCSPAILLVALALDASLGYPAALFRAAGHPVTWFGSLIALLDTHLNCVGESFVRRRAKGVIATILIVTCALAAGLGVQIAVEAALPPIGQGIVLGILSSSLLAQRSLDEHVRAVAEALEAHGLAHGRDAVAKIVGRDPATLDEAGVCRAAIESLAESASDGVVAPAFWIAVAGLPGGLAYKAINTADSMIGHRTPRHAAFGWAAARLDDIVNLPAARMTALLIVLAACLHRGTSGPDAWRSAWRDARLHQSPNAGWPEAAMAGALGLKLGGPRSYDGELVDAVTFGSGRVDATSVDVRRALSLWRIVLVLQFAIVTACVALSVR